VLPKSAWRHQTNLECVGLSLPPHSKLVWCLHADLGNAPRSPCHGSWSLGSWSPNLITRLELNKQARTGEQPETDGRVFMYLFAPQQTTDSAGLGSAAVG